ncbi:hypothetical protein BG015_007780 [Linnemannia schmuckeri]|uniref:Carrier domain-containing protein n=1 Tax=Linnemannia schmuckeri TaxID=64567 RepID=A0A9P5S698_9FUNG|nr:hypothetical protein BG015_007780 [Linnemannia schmuckeri]
MLRQLITRTPTLTRALLTPVTPPITGAAAAPYRPATSLLLSLTPSSSNYRQYTSSSSSSSHSPSKIQDLVLKSTEQLLQPPPDYTPAPTQQVLDELKARITPAAHLKKDLGMDIFKTYQLLDHIEQKLGGDIDIPVDQADKVQTLQDIVDLVTNTQK